ncbi:hypothetical protein SDC9_144389 [bioreactor metagenome]|uniref:Uncharacterized protein n=1 Tax=bioreactor metagenome TaxID=1076179 RepID=A0A645E6N0_9ZZZZ
MFAAKEEEREIPNAEKPITNRATPSPAPELIPSMYGSARGLRNKVCICNPHTDNAAPASSAVIAFGILWENIMF